jgi:hypothetical protein
MLTAHRLSKVSRAVRVCNYENKIHRLLQDLKGTSSAVPYISSCVFCLLLWKWKQSSFTVRATWFFVVLHFKATNKYRILSRVRPLSCYCINLSLYLIFNIQFVLCFIWLLWIPFNGSYPHWSNSCRIYRGLKAKASRLGIGSGPAVTNAGVTSV